MQCDRDTEIESRSISIVYARVDIGEYQSAPDRRPSGAAELSAKYAAVKNQVSETVRVISHRQLGAARGGGAYYTLQVVKGALGGNDSHSGGYSCDNCSN